MVEERGRGVNEEYEGRGAGGKLATRSSRLRSRAQSTPYNRPPPAPADKSKSGWFSKLLMKPASKILHLPSSLFLSSSKNQDQHQDQSPFEYEQDCASASASEPTSDNQLFNSKKSATDQKHDFKDAEPVRPTLDESGISEIERRLQRKKLSNVERDRLIEVLRARTIDLPDDNGEAERLKAPEVMLGRNNLRRSAEDSGAEFDSQMTPKASRSLQFTAHDVGCSPVDIAKAYMESRTSSSCYDYPTGRLKNDNNSICTDNYASKSPFTPVAKSPVCWPGASVQSDHGYFTPRRGSVLHPPRTPYSGALFSKSTSKFSVNAVRDTRSSSERSPTQVFGHNMRTSSRMMQTRRKDDATPYVSPAHDIFQKNAATSWEGSGPSDRPASFSVLSNSANSSSSFSSIERNFNNGLSKSGFHKFGAACRADEVSKFSVDSTPVHPQSSALARKILEHLDTSVPSPTEKLLEINLARKNVSRKAYTDTIDGLHDRPDLSFSGEQKSGCPLGVDLVVQGIADAQKGLPGQNTSNQLLPPPQSSKHDELGSLKGPAASSAVLDLPNNHLPNSAAPQTPSSNYKSSYATPIPVTKFGEKLKSSDNGFSFTFPASASTAAISEPPPTPTMTSPATNKRKVEAGDEGIPGFKFGAATSSERLVFSFGSTVGSLEPDAAPTPTFKFGTGKSNLSFKLIGAANAIC